MERSKGLILIVVGLAAVLIVWKVGFGPADKPKQPVTVSKQTNPNAENQQPAGNTTGLLNAQPDRNQQGNENFSRNQQRGNRGSFNDYTGMNQPFGNIGMKIAIPDKLSETELKALYEEYTQISRAAGGGRTRGGRGGMMGGGMMGGGPGGMGGDMMGGGPGGMGGGMGMGGFGG